MPVDLPGQHHPLFGRGLQAQGGDPRALGIDAAIQIQGHRTTLARQFRLAHQGVAGGKIAPGGQREVIQAQGVGQTGRRLETISHQLQIGGDILHQRLDRAGQPSG